MLAAACCLAGGVTGLAVAVSHHSGTELTSATAAPARRAAAGPAGAAQAAAADASPAASGPAGPPSAARSAPPAAAAPAASNARKGVSAWPFSGVSQALAKSGVSWYYTWSTSHAPILTPRGVQFVPMIWGPGSVTSTALSQARRDGRYLLGFNEPDMANQSNMTVAQALSLWPKLMSTGLRLGSPAVAADAATPGGWLDQFMRGAKARGYRVNFITVHWYGADFTTSQAVQQLRGYLQAIHARYHLPVWLTEFALIKFGSSATFPSPQGQAAFITAATSMLEHLSYVQRYAWFALPASAGAGGDGSAGLFRSGAVATTAGRAFEAVDAPGGT